MGLPCTIPLEVSNGQDGIPFMSTDKYVIKIHSITNIMHSFLNPNLFKICARKS